MNKVKKIGKICVLALCVLGVTAFFLIKANWPIWFGDELDRFFGEGNWQVLSSEEKESLMYTEYDAVSSGFTSGERSGEYRNWDIAFRDPYGEETVWRITNHTLKINHDEYWLLSPNRYSAKEALVLELRDIAFAAAGEEARREILWTILSEEEASCMDVKISFHGGNPEPDFYDRLWEQSWFMLQDVTVKDFLASDLYDFYLDVFVYDYRFEKLTEDQQQNVISSLSSMEKAFLQAYGRDASFEIYLGEGYQVEYENGRRIQD